MRLKSFLLTVSIALALLIMLVACVQTPPLPVPDEDVRSVVRDFNVPGTLTARTANVRELNVQGSVNLPGNSLSTADLGGFYYPLTLSGNVTGSATLSYTVSAALIPVDMEVGSINYFAREISGTVSCNLLYTTAEITPTQNTIADNVSLTAGSVVTDIVQNGALGAGYLLELACISDADETATDVVATIWLK